MLNLFLQLLLLLLLLLLLQLTLSQQSTNVPVKSSKLADWRMGVITLVSIPL